jgi:hypothetical protein
MIDEPRNPLNGGGGLNRDSDDVIWPVSGYTYLVGENLHI